MCGSVWCRADPFQIMQLPDMTSAIWSYVNALLGWAPMLVLIGVSTAAAAAAIVINMFVRAFMRG